jgi:hypothetical protein
MILFHGGCSGCTQQDTHSTEFCMGCQYFAADWDLPSLSNCPPTEGEIERKRLQEKYGVVANGPTTGACCKG